MIYMSPEAKRLMMSNLSHNGEFSEEDDEINR